MSRLAYAPEGRPGYVRNARSAAAESSGRLCRPDLGRIGYRRRGRRAGVSKPTSSRSTQARPLALCRPQKIYPKRAHGQFRTIKWLVMAVTLGIYYLVPWLRWDRGPDLPDQAVLIDMANRRLFFFFLEIWPQEFYFVTGLLVLAALAPVPRHLDRRPRLVRLHLSADGVDRSDDRGRALLAGRPQRPHAARQGAAGRLEDLSEERPRICPGC